MTTTFAMQRYNFFYNKADFFQHFLHSLILQSSSSLPQVFLKSSSSHPQVSLKSMVSLEIEAVEPELTRAAVEVTFNEGTYSAVGQKRERRVLGGSVAEQHRSAP